MKKFFYIVSFLFSSTLAVAQQQPQVPDEVQIKSFLAQTFIKDMPDYVLSHVDTLVVDEEYSKKSSTVYTYTNLLGSSYNGYIRTGDIVLCFKGKPFYSVLQPNHFMVATPEEPKVSKRDRRRAQKAVQRSIAPQQVQVPTRTTPVVGDGYGTRVIY